MYLYCQPYMGFFFVAVLLFLLSQYNIPFVINKVYFSLTLTIHLLICNFNYQLWRNESSKTHTKLILPFL